MNKMIKICEEFPVLLKIWHGEIHGKIIFIQNFSSTGIVHLYNYCCQKLHRNLYYSVFIVICSYCSYLLSLLFTIIIVIWKLLFTIIIVIYYYYYLQLILVFAIFIVIYHYCYTIIVFIYYYCYILLSLFIIIVIY